MRIAASNGLRGRRRMTLSGPFGVMVPPGLSRPMSSAVRAASVAVGLDRIAWQSRSAWVEFRAVVTRRENVQ